MLLFSFLLVALFAACTLSINPIYPIGIADPHIHVFNNTFYLFATHDFASNNTGFLMKDWWSYSSPDMIVWTRQTILNPQMTPANPSKYDECWATDAAVRNGVFFWYLSLGQDEIGVMRGPSPVGPWESPLSIPLVTSAESGILKSQMRDPCAFTDDDGEVYLIAGTFTYYIARFNEDMISFAETFKVIQVNKQQGPYGNSTDDKPFLHKAGGIYYRKFLQMLHCGQVYLFITPQELNVLCTHSLTPPPPHTPHPKSHGVVSMQHHKQFMVHIPM